MLNPDPLPRRTIISTTGGGLHFGKLLYQIRRPSPIVGNDIQRHLEGKYDMQCRKTEAKDFWESILGHNGRWWRNKLGKEEGGYGFHFPDPKNTDLCRFAKHFKNYGAIGTNLGKDVLEKA
jgi:hypothetical protein